MKFKLLSVCLLTVALVACGTGTPPPAQIQKSRIDLHKAALLNVEMGEAYLAQGQVARAKQKFLHALELKPTLPEAHSSLGYFYENVGDIDEAEVHYKQAIKLSTNVKGKFYNNYGTFLCRQARYSEADRAFNKAIKDKKYIKTAEAYENAGLCALRKPDSQQAYAYLKTAIQRDHQRYAATLELAELELKQNNYAAAKEYLNKFKTIVDPTARSLWLEIQTNTKLNNKPEVANAAQKLKSKFPQSAEYKSYLETTQHG